MPRRPTGRPTGRPPYPGPLTPAEERVLALIRDGKTNPEVAAELGLGVATVKFHVSNMLRKLDLGSRDGLATWEPPPHAGGWRRYRVIALAARAGSARPAVAGVTGALAASLVVLSLFARPRSTESPRGAEVGLPSNGAPRIPSVLYVDWAPGGGGTLHAASPTTLTDLPGRSLPPFEYGVVGLVSPSTDLVALQTPTNAEQTESRIDIFATTSLQRVASPPLTAGSQPWPIAWSPDGQTLYYTLTPPSASPAIWRFDVRTAAADRLFAPAAGYVSSAWVSPDGSKLFLLLTGPSPGPSTDPGSGLLSVAALDAASGQVLGIRPLPDILWGARPIAGADPDSTPPEYFPAAVMAPDGAAIYIAHADRDAVTVVHLPDLATQTRAITNRRSILGRIGDALLGWLAGTAEAKGGESVQRRIATSADGSLLYIGGSRGSVSRGGCARVPVVTSCSVYGPTDLQLIEAASMERIAIAEDAGDFYVSPSGGHLLVAGVRWYEETVEGEGRWVTFGLRALAADTLDQVAVIDGETRVEQLEFDPGGRSAYVVDSRARVPGDSDYRASIARLRVLDTTTGRFVAAREFEGFGRIVPWKADP